jgi:hypothetical protein
MVKTAFPCALFLSLFLYSCIGRQAYYVSPFNGISTSYHTIPMHADSVKSATYLHTLFSASADNENGTDTKFSFAGALSRSHNFGNFQAYYSAGLTFGNYKVKPYDSVGNNSTVDYRIINKNAGNYFFGGAGVDAGINFVTGSKNEEGRFGLETTMRREFGEYAKFRKGLPGTAATVIIPDQFFSTIGLCAELVTRRKEMQVGLKLAYGTDIGTRYHSNKAPDGALTIVPVHYNYFTGDLQFTWPKWTFYFQANLSGKSHGVSIGSNFYLGR